MIEGVLRTPLDRIPGLKGDVLHGVKKSSPGFCGFGEAYFSLIHGGAIKGWKRHRRMTLNLVVPCGKVGFVIYDDRIDSRSGGCFQTAILGPDSYERLTVPPGLWVAFQGLMSGDSIVLNVANEEHDPSEADNIDLGTIPYSGWQA